MSNVVQLEVDFSFEAAHRLPNVPLGHKCSRLHGHSFQCSIKVKGPIGESSGWLMDYSDIRAAIAPVRHELDHHYLNEIEGLENPTSENLAIWIWDRLKSVIPSLTTVTVKETCNARCIYEGESVG